jgi:ubiquitin-like modifier-activating enzyme ATG7
MKVHQTTLSEINRVMLLNYAPPCSIITPAFWLELHRIKLKAGLSSESIRISGQLSEGSFVFDESSYSSFNQNDRISGHLMNFNTIEDFKSFNKAELLANEGSMLLDCIKDRTAVDHPELLLRCIIISFADLKKHKFTFWGCFPVVLPLEDLHLCRPASSLDEELWFSLHTLLARRTLEGIGIPIYYCIYQDVDSGSFRFGTIAECWEKRYEKNVYFVVNDAQQHKDSNAVGNTDETVVCGWITRNLLALLGAHSDGNDKSCRVICLRSLLSRHLTTGADSGRVTSARRCLQNGAVCEGYSEWSALLLEIDLSFSENKPYFSLSGEAHKSTGWEPNSRGKPGPRVADLSSAMDPRHLLQQAVDLNLQLMRWRLWPQLNLTKIKKTRCLILGSGTLGCAVARALVGWGVEHITMLDNGRVSYSNPARQCLFEFEDAKQGKYKSIAAADALKRICPHIEAMGEVLSIPMPAHPLPEGAYDPLPESFSVLGSIENNTVQNMSEKYPLATLDNLVKSHDAVFSLLDSREGRWLPTVMAKAYDKIMITAALGFDSYLVMHHGAGVDGHASAQNCGCYFCSDIVGAKNSSVDRSLDQQCTVTRPGLSFLAAGHAVEILVGIVQKQNVPHQIRGSVNSFEQMLPKFSAFDRCIACSPQIVNKYRHPIASSEFVKNVCDDVTGTVLECVSGIAELTRDVNLDDFSESDSD